MTASFTSARKQPQITPTWPRGSTVNYTSALVMSSGPPTVPRSQRSVPSVGARLVRFGTLARVTLSVRQQSYSHIVRSFSIGRFYRTGPIAPETGQLGATTWCVYPLMSFHSLRGSRTPLRQSKHAPPFVRIFYSKTIEFQLLGFAFWQKQARMIDVSFPCLFFHRRPRASINTTFPMGYRIPVVLVS